MRDITLVYQRDEGTVMRYVATIQIVTVLVQEVIEAAGHLCIFLPKFHCELNFIEFFWGWVKRYL